MTPGGSSREIQAGRSVAAPFPRKSPPFGKPSGKHTKPSSFPPSSKTRRGTRNAFLRKNAPFEGNSRKTKETTLGKQRVEERGTRFCGRARSGGVEERGTRFSERARSSTQGIFPAELVLLLVEKSVPRSSTRCETSWTAGAACSFGLYRICLCSLDNDAGRPGQGMA